MKLRPVNYSVFYNHNSVNPDPAKVFHLFFHFIIFAAWIN